MSNISSLIIPFFVLLIVIYGALKKVDVYTSFIEGCKEAYPMIKNMFPSMLAMIFGVTIFTKSGVLDFLLSFIKNIQVPTEIISLSLLRPISSSSSLAFLQSILVKYGADSFYGNLGSIIQGSTDTTFYILTLYFGSVGIKKIRYSLIVGLLADLSGILMSIIIAKVFF